MNPTSAHRAIAAIALGCVLAPAAADDAGPYLQLAAGRTTYDFDCGYYSCDGARAGVLKLGGGYRFGVFALEVWRIDWGRGSMNDYYGNDFVRLRSLGVGGAWRAHFGSAAEGVLRAGFADVHQTRSAENFRRVEGSFGLGLAYNVDPQLAFEIGWDVTTSTGGSEHIGTVLARAVTGGLRVRF